MTQLPPWVGKLSSLYLLIGIVLTTLAVQIGIPVPDFLSGLFTQEVWDLIMGVIMSFLTLLQAIKRIVIAVPKAPTATMRILSDGEIRRYAFNPLRVGLAA